MRLIVTRRGGPHDAVGLGAGRWHAIIASRDAVADPAWPLLRAHLEAHARNSDAAWILAATLFAAVGVAVEPWALIPGVLLLAALAKRAEHRADAAAAHAALDHPQAVTAFASYIAVDGNAARGPLFRTGVRALRALGLASHPMPAKRRARFLASLAHELHPARPR